MIDTSLPSRTKHIHSYDVVVLGGGLAGALTTRLLIQAGLSVLLLTKETHAMFKCGESLPPVAMPAIKRLGLMKYLNNDIHLACPGNQSAFGQDVLIDTDFIFSEHGNGWHIDRMLFEKDVLTSIDDVNRLNIFQIDKTALVKNQWHIDFIDNAGIEQKIRSAFMVDATGRAGVLLKKFNIQSKRYDRLAARCVVYDQRADALIDQRTLIESTEQGWWYSAPTPHNKHVIMFFSDTDLPHYKAMKSHKSFYEAINKTKHVKSKLNNFKTSSPSPVFSYSAQTTKGETVTSENWLAVGDAACSFDPLSSQGMWMALLGAESAAQRVQGFFNGFKQAPLIYADWVNQQFQHYRTLYKQNYALEKRWSHLPFWKRRHQF